MLKVAGGAGCPRGGGRCVGMSGFNKDNFFEPEDDTTTFERNPELLVNTPSRIESVDERTETMLRVYGCELIQEAGILLRMHQTACITGQIIFHRFYYRVSMKRCEVRSVAKAALLLGGKIEEQPRKLHDILNVFHAAALRRHNRKIEPLVPGTKRYLEMKEDILKAEQAILRELGFIIHAEHAHKFVFYYIRVLLARGFNEQYPELAQRAWNYANDLYRSTICLKFRPNVLACGAIFLASRDLKIPLPEPTWWELFDVQKDQVYEVATGILSLYKLPKAHNINLRDEPDKDAEEGRKPADEGGKADCSADAKSTQEPEDLVASTEKDQAPAQEQEKVPASSEEVSADKALEQGAAPAATPDPSTSDKVQRSDTDSASKGGGVDKGERGERGDKRDERRLTPPSDRDRGGGRKDDRRSDGRGRDVRERDRERERDRDRSRSRDRGGGGRGSNRERTPPARRGSGRNRSSSPLRRRSRTPDRNIRRGDGRESVTSSRGGREKMPTAAAASGRDRERDRSRDRDRGGGRVDSSPAGRSERERERENKRGTGSRSKSQERSKSRSPSKSSSASPDLLDVVKARKSQSNGSGAGDDGKVTGGKDGGEKVVKGDDKARLAPDDQKKRDEERLRRREEKFGTGTGAGAVSAAQTAGSIAVAKGAQDEATTGGAGPGGTEGGSASKGGGRDAGNGKVKSPRNAPKSPRNAPRSPRKSPKLGPARAAAVEGAMAGAAEAAAQETGAKEEAGGGRKKLKVQIGQRDDLKEGK